MSQLAKTLPGAYYQDIPRDLFMVPTSLNYETYQIKNHHILGSNKDSQENSYNKFCHYFHQPCTSMWNNRNELQTMK